MICLHSLPPLPFPHLPLLTVQNCQNPQVLNSGWGLGFPCPQNTFPLHIACDYRLLASTCTHTHTYKVLEFFFILKGPSSLGAGTLSSPSNHLPDLDQSVVMVTRDHLSSGNPSSVVSVSGDYYDSSGKIIKRFYCVH